MFQRSINFMTTFQVMSGHGAYLYKFLSAHNILVHSNSAPLPTTMRHMIGIMATARLSCSYLMHHHRTELRRAAGPGSSENGQADLPAELLQTAADSAQELAKKQAELAGVL